MNRLLGFFAALAMLTMLLVPIATAAVTPEVYKQTFSVNEYTIYQKLLAKTDAELEELGWARDAISELRKIDLAKELAKRAKLDNEHLKAFGYTDKQISDLKSLDYTSGDAVERANDMGIFATFTGSRSAVAYYNRINISFVWEWSSRPLVTNTDVVAFDWQASNSQGQPINLAMDLSYSSVRLEVQHSNGDIEDSGPYYFTLEDPYGNAKCEYPMLGDVEPYGWNDYPYAKYGYAQARLNIIGSDYIHHAGLAVGYGHLTVGFGDPSVSWPAGVGISFTGSTEEMYDQVFYVYP